jgi:hypothetical protein
MGMGPIWIDWDFDYNDQLAKKYMKFKGEYYDKGTICKIKGRHGEPKLVRFKGWHLNNAYQNFELINENDYGIYDNYSYSGVNDYCLEIVMPVKPDLESPEKQNSGGFGLPEREKPGSWKIEVAWIWYVLIMLIGTIFKDRVMIWAFTTIVFFLWKNGFLRGRKK